MHHTFFIESTTTPFLPLLMSYLDTLKWLLLAFYFHLFLQKGTSTNEWIKVNSWDNLTSM